MMIFSQCPPNLNEFGQSKTAVFEPFPLDYWGEVDYYSRENNNRHEIKVNWATLSNNGRYGISDEELKQMMYKAVIMDIIESNCNFIGTKQFVFLEETECKIEKKCYLRVSLENKVYCQDIGWTGPEPSTFNISQVEYLAITKQFTCGTQCCEYIYSVECSVGPFGGSNYPHIVSITKSPAAGSDCGNTTVIDCLTEEVRNCESTCE